MTEPIDEEKIRECAYSLWKEAGSPAGREHEFWYRARELLTTPAERAIDQASEHSFPASDAVNHM